MLCHGTARRLTRSSSSAICDLKKNRYRGIEEILSIGFNLEMRRLSHISRSTWDQLFEARLA